MRKPENACRIVDGEVICSEHTGCGGAPCIHYERCDMAQTTTDKGGCRFLRWGRRCHSDVAAAEMISGCDWTPDHRDEYPGGERTVSESEKQMMKEAEEDIERSRELRRELEEKYSRPEEY